MNQFYYDYEQSSGIITYFNSHLYLCNKVLLISKKWKEFFYMKLPPLVPKITPNYSIILDATWHLGDPRKGALEFPKKHIPRARYINIDTACNQLSSFPHMLPNPSEFQKIMSKLGINENDNVLVYDQNMFSAPRIYWMLKVFGHENVSVLDGGFDKFIKENPDIDIADSNEIKETNYPLKQINKEKVVDYLEMITIIGDYSVQDTSILDARTAGRFSGQMPEPRPIPSGHCPGAINLPFQTLLNKDSTFLSKDELIKVFHELNVDLNKPVISMCGSGVTACIIYLALDIIGASGRVYDGSWTEYASNPKSPIRTYQ
jgi:thiosulfate/3-mercaptopyruvate sulfurtransferase